MAIIPFLHRGNPGLFRGLDDNRDATSFLDWALRGWPEDGAGPAGGGWTPSVDVYDGPDHLLVKADLPGVARDDIEISVQDDVLTLKGEKKRVPENAGESTVRGERFWGAFSRSFSLPAGVDASKARASYRNGVLELTLPKREEAKPRQIRVDVK